MNELTEGELEQSLIKDPSTFLQVLTTTAQHILGDSSLTDDQRQAQLGRQQTVFLKWLGHYNQNFREIIAQSVETKYQLKYSKLNKEAEAIGYRKGQLDALTALPMKKGITGKQVDLDKVVKQIRALRKKVKED